MNDTRHEASEPSMEPERRQEALIAEYGEVCNNFRTLTDIRFRLLAFLPIASTAAVVAVLVTALNTDIPAGIRLAVGLALSLFGLVATIGLATYNARNDQLYFELVSRAAAIERSLNLPDGAFANRPVTWEHVALLPGIEWDIDHGTAVRTIYGASITLWLFGTVAFVLEWCRRAYVATGLNESFSPEGSLTRAILVAVAILIALVIPIIVVYWGARRIKSKKKKRRKKMECLARDAVKVAMEMGSEAAGNEEFIRKCAAHQQFRNLCTELVICARSAGNAKENRKKIAVRVSARARFYGGLHMKRLSYYVPQDSKEICASHLIGLLTDLSPLWIYDCGTDRKGDISVKDCKKILKDVHKR